MNSIKKGDSGKTVVELQRLLGSKQDGIFGQELDTALREYQKKKGLTVDGVAGFNTFKQLYLDQPHQKKLQESDFKLAAFLLDCDIASIKAVQKVETGGSGGFLDSGKPKILFEGHIFWTELQKRKINPQIYAKSHPTILYKSWTKKYYNGGEKEYIRLGEAEKINKDAADSSTSWGMFQIMGNNYKSCDCNTVQEFVKENYSSEFSQLVLFCCFIKNNKNLYNALLEKNWTKFAKAYNGSEYAKNKYDTKLKLAYQSYKK